MGVSITTHDEPALHRKDVLLYELNEVPWQIVDLYTKERPRSILASILTCSECLTTVNSDSAPLAPWRTWPTFHTGLYTSDHNSWALGQDPETFSGEPIWEVAAKAGLRVGMFGAPQSWPPPQLSADGFCIPDTFARDSQANPAKLSRFQEFNLSMTSENAFSSNAPLNAGRVLRVGIDLAVNGLTAHAASLLVRQVLRERRDSRWKAARPMAQALPAFDLFWRLHTRRRPNLSVFFTNHVAGVLHRYWGDSVPGYAEVHGYAADDVFGRFLFETLDIFDWQLRRIRRWLTRNPATVLVIASSMGQAPRPPTKADKCYVLRDAELLMSALGLDAYEALPAMYPDYAFLFETPESAKRAVRRLGRVEVGGRPFFKHSLAEGKTLTTKLASYKGDHGLLLRALGGGNDVALAPGDLGVVLEERLGGGNTAYHVPEGIWIALGRNVEPDASRAEFSILEAKTRLLDLLGIARSAS